MITTGSFPKALVGGKSASKNGKGSKSRSQEKGFKGQKSVSVRVRNSKKNGMGA